MALNASYFRRRSLTSQISRKALGIGIGEVGGKMNMDVDGGGAALLADGATHCATNVGTKNGSTVSVVEHGFGGFIHKTVLTLTATPIDIADSTAGGGVLIYTFPAGMIVNLGGYLSVAPTTTSTIATTLKSGVTIEMGVGSASAGAAALTTTEEDYITGVSGPTSTVINVAAAAIVAARTIAVATLDGHTTPSPAYLNIGVPTATDIDGDATVTLTGTVTLLWVFGGDF